MMLSKDTIKKAINDGIITFVADPTAESGTVCKIGNNWFYFGGQTAEQYNPNDYLKYADIDDIVNNIHEVLDEFSRLDMFHDEYLYYEAYITHNLKVKNDTITVEADNIGRYKASVVRFTPKNQNAQSVIDRRSSTLRSYRIKTNKQRG